MAGGWASLGLMPELVAAVQEEMGWILPSAVQEECIPLILGGSDVMASAETGSGKTAAFALPIIQLVAEEILANSKKHDSQNQRINANVNANAPAQLFFCMSAQDRDSSLSIHPSSRNRVQSRDPSQWAGCRTSSGVALKPGGFVFECKILDKGIVRVGWSTADASLTLGTDIYGYGYGGTGMKVSSGNYQAYPDKDKISFGEGDVIGCCLEVKSISDDAGSKAETVSIRFAKNGTLLDEAFNFENKGQETKALFPSVCLKDAECQLNFGGDQELDFSYDGYVPIASAAKTLNDSGVVNPRDASAALHQEHTMGPFAIVIEPTRDLAQQTFNVFEDFMERINSEECSTQAALLVGGVKPNKTLRLLEQDKVDVLVGTPPIIASYMKKGTISPSRCRFFCLDEADELITSDSIEHIRAVYSRLLASQSQQSAFSRLQVCFFSATLHDRKVQALAETLCHQPLWVDLRGQNDSTLPDTVHHVFVSIPPLANKEKDSKVVTDATHRQGKLKQPTDWEALSQKETNSERIKLAKPWVLLDLMEKFAMDQVLIFCRTNLDCDLMEKFFRGQGAGGPNDKYTCRVLAGMRSMEERQASLKDFKEGEARILIATDVAARGIDIRELPFVINYTLPDRPESYVHRIGRVGRAERMGLAISLVGTVDERVWFCRKPKKPPCGDTRDYDKGGNCVWYGEPDLLKQIESLLAKNKVKPTKMSCPDIDIPPEVKTILEGGGYGNVVGRATDPELEAKMKTLEGSIEQVELTELSLQSNYWNLRDKFKAR
jgi:ATP-dependent RNA helicase DDX1